MLSYTQESEKNKKALLYTLLVYALLFLLFFITRWHSQTPPATPVMDLIEVNLGNNLNGDGDNQPLIKGKQTITKEENSNGSNSPSNQDEQVNKDDELNNEAATIVKSDNKKNNPSNTKKDLNNSDYTNNNKSPKITYNGPDKGKNGNNTTEDNEFKYQGNNKNKIGDNGDPKGDKDSYGDTPGGKKGGPKVIKGNRRIIDHYQFEGDLNKATIYAVIIVSPSGKGRFITFDKGSTTRNQAYANAINNYLNKMEFNKADQESQITVEFKFDVH